MASGTINYPFPDNMKLTSYSPSASTTSDSFTMSSAYRGIVFIIGSSATYKSAYEISTTNSGDVDYVLIGGSNNLTISKSTNVITFGHTNATLVYLFITLSGSMTPN